MQNFLHLGYPIAEVSEDGAALLTKAPGTGGRVASTRCASNCSTKCTTRTPIYSPDVVLDMGDAEFRRQGNDAVRITGASGAERPDTLKVVAGYHDGWMGQCVVGFSWPDAMAKARATIESVRTQLVERGLAVDELQTEFLGHDAFLGPTPIARAKPG